MPQDRPVISFMFFLSCVCFACVHLFYVPCGHLLGKGSAHLLALVCGV